MKALILLILLTCGSANAVTITQQGSGEMSWLTNGNSCWRACFKAVNQAKTRIQNIASAHCPAGYSITKYPKCSWPASDPSFLDMDGVWPVCKCSDTCTASFQCNNTGQKPSFFGNVANQWRQIRVFTKQHRTDVKKSYESMHSIRNAGALVQAVNYHVMKHGTNAAPFFKKLEYGLVDEVSAPIYENLLREFNVSVVYPITPIKGPGKEVPIVPVRPIEPGTPIKPIKPIGPYRIIEASAVEASEEYY